MIVVEYPEISSSIPTNLINTSHFFQQQHQQQQQLNRNNCGIIKNSISGSTTSIKNQNIDGNSPSNPASSSATVSSPTAGATGGTGLPNTIISNSINNCNNINAVKKNNKQQNTGVQQQLHTSNQNSYSQSPIISPASAGSLSISSVAGILLSPVSNCSKSNLILSGSCTSTNTSETNLNSSFSGGNINLLKQQPQQHLSQFHHQQQQQQQQQQSQSSLLHQHQEKNQQKNQYLNTFSIPINSGCLSIHSNSQQHHRNSTPSILCTINNFSASSSGINQSNTINSNINFKSVNMDPHHIRHSGLPGNRPELYQKCNRGSHSSDTSSAYSGSDTMTSVHSSSLDTDEVDLSGLVESVVDSDEEDLAESMDSLNVRDAVRDCLEKDPSERTEDDIEALLELTQGLKAFTNMTLAVRKALCSVMVFAVVDKAGTMVMSDGEELDSWSVLINGHVEIEHKNGEKEELHVGDSFGILPTMDKLYHRGVMRTKCDDCQFVCITQTDYYRIQHQGEENTKRHEDENGQVVMVTELRQIGPDTAGTSSRRGHVVIRGTISRLMVQLIEENSMTDPTYVEDFLLTHRTFIENPKEVAKQLLQWFENEDTSPLHTNASGMEIRDRVSRVILLWVNNHFTDFEMDPEMMEFLETFEMGLEQKQMPGQLRLLHIACAAKARTRNVTLTRSSRDEDLNFKIIGPTERGSYGIFVSHIERKTKAEDVGLKRGDQILEVNGQSFEHVTHSRAMEILMGSTHLSITVKSNLLAFKEMLQQSDTKSPRSRSNRNRICVSDLAKLNSNDPRQTAAAVARLSTHELLSTSMTATGDQVDYCQSSFRDLSSQGNPSNSCNFVSNFLHNPTRKDSNQSSGSASNKGGFMTLGPKRRIQKALIKMNLLPKNNSSSSGQQINNPGSNCDDEDSSLLGNNNNDSKGITNSVIGSGASLPGSRSNNNSNNSSNKMNSANSNNMQTSNMRNNISENSTPSLYHCHSNPDLTSVASKSVTIVGNNDNEINQNSQTDSLANMNTNNVSLNTCIAAQQILTPQHQSGTIYYEDTRQSDYPEHVLKVYKSDQTCKYLLINKETTAHEVVMLALQEFGIHETSSNFSLCEVSVSEGGMIKQRRLPEHLQNLAERIGLSARYYLKTNGITETLVPDDLAPDLVRESVVHLLQLNANEVAIQLTFQDFAIFRQIESTEYVDDLFEIQSRYGTPMLKQFSELVNREMFWVVTEVCSEHNMVRRMKIVKQFIKIARHCKECRNFNSMFAIISGLGHAAVSRLRQTWEKLPTKYQKLFNDLQDLMDPSRNMSKYRQLVSAELLAQHPIIPFYPVVKKDLTFIHLGNDTRVENLINFEKLRMIAKEVRLLTHMCSSTYDLLTMLEFKGQPPSSAMVALNQMSVSTGPCAGSSSGNNSNSGSNVGVGSVIGGTMSGVTSLLYVGGGNATVKRRKKSAAAPNPKKMFEEAQMVRRVKAYLNNMKIMTDEDVLHNLSLECEASTGGHGGGGSIGCNSAPNTTTTVRKRHPSPTLSTTSSTSSTSEGKKGSLGGASNVGPKFGTASPQAVKKILSLSESTKTRPHQPRHPSIQLPLVNVGNLHHPFSHTSISPSPSPGSHRRMGSCSSTSTTGSGNVTNNGNNSIGIVSPAGTVLVSAARGIHERSHSDTPTPLPSVDLSAESSSVTSLSNLPLRKNITLAGSVTSNDSGHGSCVQAEIHSNCSDSSSSSGLYHVASSIVHNSPSPTLQQRRHSSTHAGLFICPTTATSPSPSACSFDSGIHDKPPPIPPPHHSLQQQHLSQRAFSPSMLDCKNQTSIASTTATIITPSSTTPISSNQIIGIALPAHIPVSVPISLLTNNLQSQLEEQQQHSQFFLHQQQQQQQQQSSPSTNHSCNDSNHSLHTTSAVSNFLHFPSNNATYCESMKNLTVKQQQQNRLKNYQLASGEEDLGFSCGDVGNHTSGNSNKKYNVVDVGNNDGDIIIAGGNICVGNNNSSSGKVILNYKNKSISPAIIDASSSGKLMTIPSSTQMVPITTRFKSINIASTTAITTTITTTTIVTSTITGNTTTQTTSTSSQPQLKNLLALQQKQTLCQQPKKQQQYLNYYLQQNSNNNCNNINISNINDNLIVENLTISGNGGGDEVSNNTNVVDHMSFKDNNIIQAKQCQQQKQSHHLGNTKITNFKYIHQQEIQQSKQQQQQSQLQHNQISSNLVHTTTTTPKIGHSIMAPPPPKGPRHPPAYSVAAQMARLHRLGRAHSHEGVTTAIQGGGNLSGVATGQGLLPPIGVATTTTTTITTTTSITTVSPPLNISSNVSTAGSILPTSNIPNTTQILSTTIQQNNGNNLLQQQQQQQQQQSQQLNLNNILPISSGYFQHYSHHHHLSNIGNDDDDEDAQVSAV